MAERQVETFRSSGAFAKFQRVGSLVQDYLFDGLSHNKVVVKD